MKLDIGKLMAINPPIRMTALSLCLSLTILCCCNPLLGQGKGKRGPSLVRVDKVVVQNRNVTQNFIGSLRPSRRAVIGSGVDGRVEDVLVKEGFQVGADSSIDSAEFVGQPIVEIKKTTLDIEIDAAKIELLSRQNVLAELETSMPREIAVAKAKTKQSEAQLSFAKTSMERIQRLGSNGISQKEIDEVNSQYKLQLQIHNANLADLEKLESTKQLRQKIAAQRVKAQEAELRRLSDLRSKYTIRAPFSGFVSRKLVERGDWVNRGAPVAEIIQLDPIELKVNVPQRFIHNLQKSFDESSNEKPLQVKVTLNSHAELFYGKVKSIVPEADSRSRTFPVIIQIDNKKTNKGYVLKSGMLARASLAIGEPKPVKVISKDALVLSNDKIEVFVVDASSKVRSVQVKTGAADGEKIEVIGDLKRGDMVVTHGNERLRAGQQVKVIN